MIYPDSPEFKDSIKKGEWRIRNNKWYRAIVKKEWEMYALQTCPVCTKKFLTRHHSQTCSKPCKANFYWSNIPLKDRRKSKYHTEHGYIIVYDENGDKIAEHRYVMAQIIGRKLNSDEHVHHINGDRSDNHPENLIMVTRSGHNIMHKPEQAKNRKRTTGGKFI